MRRAAVGRNLHLKAIVVALLLARTTLVSADCTDRREALRTEAHRGRVWGVGWAMANGALLVGSVSAIPFFDHDQQIDLAFGAGTSAIGVVSTLASPVTWLHPYDDCDAVERELSRAADAQAFGKSWLAHTGNVLINGGAGLALGLGWDHWRSAAIQGGVGILVGELMIYTQPDGAVQLAVSPTAGGAIIGFAGVF